MWCAVRIPIDRSLQLLLIGLGLLGPLTAADVCASICTLVRAEAKKQDIPAISVAIVRNNQIACSVALGWADLEQRIPNTPKSRHRLASLSKPVTAVLTMKLMEEGRLALDDSICRLMPELPERYAPVTVRRLLAHQRGI